MKPVESISLPSLQAAVKCLNEQFGKEIRYVGVKKTQVIEEFTAAYDALVDTTTEAEMLSKAEVAVAFYNDIYADEIDPKGGADPEPEPPEKEEPLVETSEPELSSEEIPESSKEVREEILESSKEKKTKSKKEPKEKPVKEPKPPKEKPPAKEKEPIGRSRYGHVLGSGKAKLDEVFFEGATLADAAKKTGLTEARAKTHVLRILKGYHKLTVEIKEHGEGEKFYKVVEPELPAPAAQ
jgi:outer membrane biosynthesis protein TonB